MERKITKALILAAIMTLLLGILATALLPAKAELSDGFISPIIAFELARVPQDIAFLTGDGEAATMRQQMRHGLIADVFFPFAYSAFMFLLLLKASVNSNYKKAPWYVLVGVFITLLIPFVDLAENWSMAILLSQLDAGNTLTNSSFNMLKMTTWLKWLMIATAFLCLALHYFKVKHKASCFVTTLTGVTMIVAWLSLSPLLGELMALTMMIALIVLFVKYIRELRAKEVV